MEGGNPSPPLPFSPATILSKELSSSSSHLVNFCMEDFPSLQKNGVLSTWKRVTDLENKSVNQQQIVLGSTKNSENNNGLKSTSSISTSIGDCSVNVGNPNSSIGNLGAADTMDWRAKFPLPRVISPQPSMKYTPPSEVNGKILVAAQSENFTEGIKKCEELVVGFFVGPRLSFAAVRAAVNKLWKFNKEVSIKLHDECAFIFKFNDDEDRRKVLEIGSFYISKDLFTLRPWSYLLEKSASDIKSVPIWVMIFGVPLHMWNNEGLSLIASYLGKPILADDCTLKQDRLAFARICIEINTDFAYPSSIPLLIDGKIAMDLPVEYQWKPPLCSSCLIFGHDLKICTRKGKARWIPKKSRIVQLDPRTGDSIGDKMGSSQRTNDSEESASPSLNMSHTCKEISGGSGTKTVEESDKGLMIAQNTLVNDVSGTRGSKGANTSVEGVKQDNKLVTNSKSPNKTACCGHKKVDGLVKPIDESTSSGSSKVITGVQNSEPGVQGDWIKVNGEEDVQSATVKEASNVSGESKKNSKVSKATVGSCDTNKVCGMGVTTDEKVVISSDIGKKAIAGNSSNKAMDTSSSPEIEAADKDKGGVWTEVKGKKKGNSPKKNPFMVYSDFTDESRFPINKVGAIERSSYAKCITPIKASNAIEEGATSTKVAMTREYTYKATDLECSDEEFERKNRFLSLEEKALKRQEREMHRLQWNGQSGIKNGKGSESLGRGQRTQHKKAQYG